MTADLSIASSTEEIPDDLISTRAAAALIDVDPNTIVNWIKSRDLRGWRVNRCHWRVRRSQVLSLIQPVEIEATAAECEGAA